MFTQQTKRLARAVLLASLLLPAAAMLVPQASRAAPPVQSNIATSSTAPADAPIASTDEETALSFKKTLADYGNFVQLEGYGEVWVPTVTPEGWHPYPPCHWIYTEDAGWYFSDDTPWGAIVHHYGRWSHDAKIGWFWVLDTDWSPGWVVWRDSDKWIGWAPMPPDQDAQKVSLEEFDKDKMWIFMETAQFTNGCGGTVVASDVYGYTEPVSLFELPHGHIVKVHVVTHWKVKVIKKIIVVDRRCPPRQPPATNIPQRTLYDVVHPTDATPQRHRSEGDYQRHRVERQRHRDRVTGQSSRDS